MRQAASGVHALRVAATDNRGCIKAKLPAWTGRSLREAAEFRERVREVVSGVLAADHLFWLRFAAPHHLGFGTIPAEERHNLFRAALTSLMQTVICPCRRA
jgi:hypothetical protein